MEELDGITQEIFSKPIDLNEDEVLVLEPKDKESPVDKADLTKEWKRYIKYNILQEMEVMSNREERRKKLKDSLIANKLKDTVTLKILSPEEKKIKATEEIKDLMSNMFKRFQKEKNGLVLCLYERLYRGF